MSLRPSLGWLTATVTGPEPLRGCVARELASMAPVAPTTSCTIAIGNPALMAGEPPAIGSETACPAALR